MVKPEATFRALAIDRSNREVLVQSGTYQNSLPALECLHDKTAVRLADMFPDELQDSRDLVTASPMTGGAANYVSSLPSPEGGMEHDCTFAPKEEESKYYTGDSMTVAELDMPHSGNLVYVIDTPAQGSQRGAAAYATVVQSTGAIRRQIPSPEIETVPDPIPSELQPMSGEVPAEAAPTGSEPINLVSASGPSMEKRGKREGKVVPKMVQAIEDRAAVFTEPPLFPPPTTSMVEAELPVEPRPPLEPLLSLPQSPRRRKKQPHYQGQPHHLRHTYPTDLTNLRWTHQTTIGRHMRGTHP
jgi:hypothetical protein